METKIHGAPTTNIFSMIAWFIFVVIFVASVGVYVYEQYITKSITAKNAELTNIFTQFDVSSVDHFVQLDSKLKSAKSIIDSHLAFSTLLGLISVNTVRSIQFTDLKYAYDDVGNKVSIALNGKAPDFASVALQSDKFFSLPYFREQIFSGTSLDQAGNVLFNYSAFVDPAVLKYQPLATSSLSN